MIDVGLSPHCVPFSVKSVAGEPVSRRRSVTWTSHVGGTHGAPSRRIDLGDRLANGGGASAEPLSQAVADRLAAYPVLSGFRACAGLTGATVIAAERGRGEVLAW
ncbi:hypothetical protein ACIBCN_11440 [Nocardia sp. NPDC051052]|uniref:hypothetical protein n=1 Tax=Nocardia sp. NPDC051052 TaxID=3364322 RepID=UPI0037ABA848